jgi:chemotaxis response regulator CheB
MGRDGAEGLAAMRRRGARTIAQDEQSCVVWGMPRAAVEAGAVDVVASPDEIVTYLLAAMKA